jgi:tryptophanyl-tRNA synthetase
MSLTKPEEKMSKSDENDNSRINLTDPADIIRKKVSRAETDSEIIIRFDPVRKPGVSNLLNIYSSLTDKPVAEIEKDYLNKNYGAFKSDLAEIIIAKLEPFQANMKKLEDRDIVKLLEKGATKLAPTATKTLERVKRTIGLGL